MIPFEAERGDRFPEPRKPILTHLRCFAKWVGSLFHLKVRWGEDSIFNAAAGVGRKPRPAAGIKGVHRLHEPDGADGNKVLLISRQGVVFFYDVRYQPQIVADQLFPRGGISGVQGTEGGGFLPGCERTRKAAAFQMERQKQKFCGEKLQQGQQHMRSLPIHSC